MNIMHKYVCIVTAVREPAQLSVLMDWEKDETSDDFLWLALLLSVLFTAVRLAYNTGCCWIGDILSIS